MTHSKFVEFCLCCCLCCCRSCCCCCCCCCEYLHWFMEEKVLNGFICKLLIRQRGEEKKGVGSYFTHTHTRTYNTHTRTVTIALSLSLSVFHINLVPFIFISYSHLDNQKQAYKQLLWLSFTHQPARTFSTPTHYIKTHTRTHAHT